MIGVDVGGTFTDVVKIADGRIIVTKVPTDLASSDRSVLAGAEELGATDLATFNLASTAGLNSVITRKIPKTALLTSLGHRDIIDRGRLGRPQEALTDPSWRREFGDTRRPLIPRYLRRGIAGRITSTGEILIDLDEDQAREQLQVLKRCNVEAVAICFMNAYLNPAHEQIVRAWVAEELGPIPCSISSEVSPLAKEFTRTMTTVIDVIMKTKYTEYTDRLDNGLAGLGFKGRFNYADCAARLLPSDYAMERPYRLVVGGPAAGAAASAHFGAQIGDMELLCADVGGTSCDISLVHNGSPRLNSTFEMEFDMHVTALSTDIVALGAGGGSIISISSTGEVQVGPESAGAHPGPACYGQGGTQPTVTDAALVAGILDPNGFLGGKKKLDVAAALEAFKALDTPLPLEERIDFAWRTGIHNIANGLLTIGVRHGVDVRNYSMVAFGAAGGMMLPSVLNVIPLRRVIVPPHPGLFSALGLLSSNQVFSDHKTAYTLMSPDAAEGINGLFQKMEADLRNRSGGNPDVKMTRSYDGRLYGQSAETPFVPVPDGDITAASVQEMVDSFHRIYAERNGNAFLSIPVQGVTFRVEMHVPTPRVEYPRIEPAVTGAVPIAQSRLNYLAAEDRTLPIYERASLKSGHKIAGPSIIREPLSTVFVPAGTLATVGDFGEISITKEV